MTAQYKMASEKRKSAAEKLKDILPDITFSTEIKRKTPVSKEELEESANKARKTFELNAFQR
jgi:hypothetical protein